MSGVPIHKSIQPTDEVIMMNNDEIYDEISLVPRLPDLFQRTRECVEKDRGAWGRGYDEIRMKTASKCLACMTGC